MAMNISNADRKNHARTHSCKTEEFSLGWRELPASRHFYRRPAEPEARSFFGNIQRITRHDRRYSPRTAVLIDAFAIILPPRRLALQAMACWRSSWRHQPNRLQRHHRQHPAAPPASRRQTLPPSPNGDQVPVNGRRHQPAIRTSIRATHRRQRALRSGFDSVC